MEWIEEKRDGYSVFRSGDYTLEPEDLDFDEWSLFCGLRLISEGRFDDLKAVANLHNKYNEDQPNDQ